MILAVADRAALGSVRCFPGLQAAEEAAMIWVRGIPAGSTAQAIRQLPALHSYQCDKEGRLFPLNGLTPVGRLKELAWQPLTSFLPLELPVSLYPGRLSQKHSVRLVPATADKSTKALLTSRQHWIQYAEYAPLARLERLQFTLSKDDEVLVIGEPSPAIPGKTFWQQEQLLLPVGFDVDPSFTASLISEELVPYNDAWLLFDIAGNCQQIPIDHFMPARRSVIRQLKTAGGQHG